MEFIRYVSKDNIKELMNHSINLDEFIKCSYGDKDVPENSEYPDEWQSDIEVKIIIEDFNYCPTAFKV